MSKAEIKSESLYQMILAFKFVMSANDAGLEY